MSYLLDTNVVSELRKRPEAVDPRVLAWSQRRAVDELFISVVTLMEIELGVARLERRDPRQGAMLRAWLEVGVLGGFSGRTLPISIDVAHRAAHLHVPDPHPERDAWIAAAAAEQGMTVVTRNVADFEPVGVPVLNPWLSS